MKTEALEASADSELQRVKRPKEPLTKSGLGQNLGMQKLKFAFWKRYTSAIY